MFAQITLEGSGGQYPCPQQLLHPAVVLRSESGGADVVGASLRHLASSFFGLAVL